MPDDPLKKQLETADRVSTSERWELDFWKREFGCSEEGLKEAVENVGNGTQAIKEYLANT